MEDPPQDPYMSDGPANLLRADIIEPNSPVAQPEEAYFRNQGIMLFDTEGRISF